MITPGDPGTTDIKLEVNSAQDVSAISPYIYGTNQPNWSTTAKHLTLGRLGGNRWTAYNWENNASNAGTDWQNQNDDYLGGGNTPGEAVRASVAAAHQANASMIVTVPIQGYVAADKSPGGDVNQTPNYLQTRFNVTKGKKGSAFSNPPSLTDKTVYQDEFVSMIEGAFPNAKKDPSRTIFYMLDNEPDLWNGTHPRIEAQPVKYKELTDKSIEFADAIKSVAPSALVFGAVNYGWNGFVTLQDATDANNRDFLDYFLSTMAAAEKSHGKRLVDVLDLHWYPEAQGDGQRIVGEGTSAGLIAAREQAPRSLWDSSYTETSWITQYSTNGPINLIPRIRQKIAAEYPGTKLSISEYNYGGGAHISGALAQADVLGAFGREGIFAASLWEMAADQSYIYGGFAMFRNYDGNNGSFGNTSIRVSNSDIGRTSGYASIDQANSKRLVVVVINKHSAALTAGIRLSHNSAFTKAEVYRLSAGSSVPSHQADIPAVATNAFKYSMPAQSVTTLVFLP